MPLILAQHFGTRANIVNLLCCEDFREIMAICY